MKSTYLMESPDEIERLELKTDAAVVANFARRAGLRPGMRVADVFCGSGAATAVLRDMVGPAGYAAGFDASAERVAYAREHHGGPGTEFIVADARSPFPAAGTFDFVWVRFALEYWRAEAFDIVRNITTLLAPDGVLCLIDLDHNCLSHYGMPLKLKKAFLSVMRQLVAVANFDPYAGRRLYSHLFRLAFRDIRVEMGAHHLIYGELGEVDRFNWFTKLDTVKKNVDVEIPGYADPAEFRDDFMRFFSHPGRFTYTPVIACWGRRPND